MERRTGAHMTGNPLGQRLHQRRHMTDPARHDGAVDLHAAASVNVGLAMQRQMIAIFGDEDVGEQRRTGASLLDRQRRHRRLHDRLAGAATHLRAHVQHALKVRGHVFQHHALVGADPSELRFAAGRADAGRFVRDGLKRQVIGQRRAHRRLLRRRRRGRGCVVGSLRARLSRGVALFHVAEQQFQLLDLAVELLRRAPEASAPKDRQLHSQLLNQQRLGVDFRCERRREPPQFGGIFGQIGSGARHAFA